jgi:hypothetical protein
MHTSSLPHGAGVHRRLAVLAIAVTAVAVVTGVTLADLRAPAGTETVTSAAATDEALALAPRRHHAPLVETAPALPAAEATPAAGAGEPFIKSAE